MKVICSFIAACAVFALSTSVAHAKRGTIGIFAIVESVEIQPQGEAPQRILIRGLFVVPEPMSSGNYQPPQRGYLYFKLPPGQQKLMMQEWRKLQALAGTGEVIGFAQYWQSVPDPANPSGNTNQALIVSVNREGDEAVLDNYPEPNARGMKRSGDRYDPDFETIANQLRAQMRDRNNEMSY